MSINTVTFFADRKSFAGPSITDSHFTIRFDTGEYQKQEVLKVAQLPDKRIYKVTVEVVDDIDGGETLPDVHI